jgi:hypothetical protein
MSVPLQVLPVAYTHASIFLNPPGKFIDLGVSLRVKTFPALKSVVVADGFVEISKDIREACFRFELRAVVLSMVASRSITDELRARTVKVPKVFRLEP